MTAARACIQCGDELHTAHRMRRRCIPCASARAKSNDRISYLRRKAEVAVLRAVAVARGIA